MPLLSVMFVTLIVMFGTLRHSATALDCKELSQRQLVRNLYIRSLRIQL